MLVCAAFTFENSNSDLNDRLEATVRVLLAKHWGITDCRLLQVAIKRKEIEVLEPRWVIMVHKEATL